MIHFLIGVLFGALPFVLYLSFFAGESDPAGSQGGLGSAGSDPPDSSTKIRD